MKPAKTPPRDRKAIMSELFASFMIENKGAHDPHLAAYELMLKFLVDEAHTMATHVNAYKLSEVRARMDEMRQGTYKPAATGEDLVATAARLTNLEKGFTRSTRLSFPVTRSTDDGEPLSLR